jgi:feruloyl esterase
MHLRSLIPILALAAGPAFAMDCGAMKSHPPAGAVITLAEDVTPAPRWEYPASVFTKVSPVKTTGVAFCRVTGTIGQEIQFEVWLPKQWNGRYQGVGNGGLTGALNYPAMGEALADGYATASTDTGHVTTDGFFQSDWIPGHEDRVVNFAYQAHHLLAAVAKAIVQTYYAKAAAYAYFNGCSSGGWEGLSEAERFPDDYDGIAAGAPAINFVRLQLSGLMRAQAASQNPAGVLTSAKAALLARAAIAKCDAKDGVEDGVIEDPTACGFDPVELACKSGDQPGCLTPDQVATARASYGPQRTKGGLALYPGVAVGAPAMPDLPNSSPDQSMIVLVLHNLDKPVPALAELDPDRDLPRFEQAIGGMLDTMNPDLGAFAAKGGKLLLYHGWADPLLSPYNTIDYYQRVEQAMGGADKTGRFARLFMVPGMAHCRGGPGTDIFDKMSTLTQWVEHGTAPERITAERRTNGKTDRTRPLCVYPATAHYKGEGSTDDAANFTCR